MTITGMESEKKGRWEIELKRKKNVDVFFFLNRKGEKRQMMVSMIIMSMCVCVYAAPNIDQINGKYSERRDRASVHPAVRVPHFLHDEKQK